jgi:hypothetical protein
LCTLILYICFYVILQKQSTFGLLPSRAKGLTEGGFITSFVPPLSNSLPHWGVHFGSMPKVFRCDSKRTEVGLLSPLLEDLYFRKLPHHNLLPAREKRPAISGQQKTIPPLSFLRKQELKGCLVGWEILRYAQDVLRFTPLIISACALFRLPAAASDILI